MNELNKVITINYIIFLLGYIKMKRHYSIKKMSKRKLRYTFIVKDKNMHKLNKVITINYIIFLLGCIKIKRHSIKMSNHNLDIFYCKR